MKDLEFDVAKRSSQIHQCGRRGHNASGSWSWTPCLRIERWMFATATADLEQGIAGVQKTLTTLCSYKISPLRGAGQREQGRESLQGTSCQVEGSKAGQVFHETSSSGLHRKAAGVWTLSDYNIQASVESRLTS